MGTPEVKVGDEILVRMGGREIKAPVTRVAARGIVSVDANPQAYGGPLYEYSADKLEGTWVLAPKTEEKEL